MNTSLLNNILATPKADTSSQLFGAKKIDSSEAEMFAKLLQGSLDLPMMVGEKKTKNNGDQFLQNIGEQTTEKNGEQKTINIGEQQSEVEGLIDNSNVMSLFGGSLEASQSVVSDKQMIELIASNPKLIEVFEKTDRVEELPVRLRDLMIRDPKLANELKGIVEKIENSENEAKEILKLGKLITKDIPIEMPASPRRHIAKIANYGASQNIINKNLITPKKSVSTNTPAPQMIDSELTTNLDERAFQGAQKINLQQQPLSFSAAPKVLDMSSVSTTNSSELMSKISNYIQQSNLENKQSLDLTVRHDELGQFKINVSKLKGTDQLDLKIMTSNKEAQMFFSRNEGRLVQALEMSGVKLADVRIIAGSETTRSDADSRGSFSENGSNQGRGQQQHANKDGSSSDSRRRQELWEMFKERNAA